MKTYRLNSINAAISVLISNYKTIHHKTRTEKFYCSQIDFIEEVQSQS